MSKDVFTAPSRLEQDSRHMQLLPVYEHQKLSKDYLWTDIRSKVVELLDQQSIQHSFIDLVCSWVEENQEDEEDDTGTAPYGTFVAAHIVSLWPGASVVPNCLHPSRMEILSRPSSIQ